MAHASTAALREATQACFAAMIAGEAPAGLSLPEGQPVEGPEVLAMLAGLARDVSATFAPAAWLIVEGSELVGLCSIVSRPHDGGIDVGYGVTACRRGRGHATRTVAQLLKWARGDARVARVRAETSVANPASQAVLVSNGFTQTGRRHDRDDGDLDLLGDRDGGLNPASGRQGRRPGVRIALRREVWRSKSPSWSSAGAWWG